MKKEYRNSLRSKRMIKEAFMKLVQKKDMDKITIKEITDMCDLSRNTFYLHYQDVYAILEESQDETINHLNEVLDNYKDKKLVNAPLPFLNEIANTINENKEQYRILLNINGADIFIEKIKRTFLDHVMDTPFVYELKNPSGYIVFLDILATGSMNLFKICLKSDTDLSIEDIVKETNEIYMEAVSLYL